jgi:hypothetical protein
LLRARLRVGATCLPLRGCFGFWGPTSRTLRLQKYGAGDTRRLMFQHFKARIPPLDPLDYSAKPRGPQNARMVCGSTSESAAQVKGSPVRPFTLALFLDTHLQRFTPSHPCRTRPAIAVITSRAKPPPNPVRTIAGFTGASSGSRQPRSRGHRVPSSRSHRTLCPRRRG